MSDFFAEDSTDFSDVVGAVMGGQFDQEAPAADAEGTTEPEAVGDPEVAPAEVVENAEEEKPERARDEKGRFAREEPAEPELILGKFKSTEDLVESYRQLEARLGQTAAERQELNELRQLMEDRFNQVQQQVNQPRHDFESLIEQNPAQAAMLAYQANDQYALRRAAEAWEEISPGAPALWVQNIEMQRRLDALDQRLQPLQENQQERSFARGLREVEQEFGPLPEIIARAEQANIPNETAQLLLHTIQNGTPDQQVGAIKTLALLSAPQAGPQADNLGETARAIAREQAQEADRAVAEAAVASASQTRPEPAAPKGLADRLWDAWEQDEAPRRDGYSGF